MADGAVSVAAHISATAGLTVSDIARATGAGEAMVESWLQRTTASPEGCQTERLEELATIVDRLVRLIEPTYVAVWMRSPVPMLEGRAPLDAIASGDALDVARLVSGLESPGAL